MASKAFRKCPEVSPWQGQREKSRVSETALMASMSPAPSCRWPGSVPPVGPLSLGKRLSSQPGFKALGGVTLVTLCGIISLLPSASILVISPPVCLAFLRPSHPPHRPPIHQGRPCHRSPLSWAQRSCPLLVPPPLAASRSADTLPHSHEHLC